MKIRKLVGFTLAMIMLATLNAQDLGKLRGSIINDADESKVTDYLNAREKQSPSHFFDIFDDLIKIEEFSKRETNKTNSYKNILDTILKRIDERSKDDLGSLFVLTAFNQKTGKAKDTDIQLILDFADQGNAQAAYVALKMGCDKSFKLEIAPEKLKEYDNVAALGGIYEHLAYLAAKALERKDVDAINLYVPLLKNILESDFSEDATLTLVRYATMLFKGDLLPEDKEKSIEIFEFLLERKSEYAFQFLYFLYSESPDERFLNPEKAEEIKAKAIEYNAGKFYFGMARARSNGNAIFTNPFSVKVDKKEAVELLEKSALAKNRLGAYFAALRRLDPTGEPTFMGCPREAYNTASLENQKIALEYFDVALRDPYNLRGYFIMPYAAIYFIGAPELRDTAKGIEVLEKLSNRHASASPLPLLYAMATKGIFMDKDEVRAKKYADQAETVFDNMNEFYFKVASIFENDNCNISPMYFYFIDEDSNLGLHYATIAFDKGNTDAAWRLLREFTNKGQFDKAKEFLDKIDSADALNLKMFFARDYKDTDYSFLVITDALKKGYSFKNRQYELGSYFAASLSGKNKYISAIEAEKILEDFEKNPPEWILEKYSHRTRSGVEYKESALGNIFVWIGRYLSGRYFSPDGETMYPQNLQLAEKYLLKAIDLGSVEALGTYTSHLLNEKNDMQNAIKYAKAYMKETNDASDIFSQNRYSFVEELKRNPQPVIELFEYGAKAESPYALLMLSSIYEDGIYVEKNPEKATEYTNKAYNCKDTKKLADDLCSFAMDMVYSRFGREIQNPDKVLSMLKKSSSLGSGRAGDELIQIYIYSLKPQNNRYMRPGINFDTITLDMPIIDALKKYKNENKGKSLENLPKLPPEITNEFFRLIMEGDGNNHTNIIAELYLSFRDGIGFIEQDTSKAHTIREKFSNSYYFRNGDSVEENIIYTYIQGGTLIEQDLLKAVGFIEKKNTLSGEDLNMLKNIKIELEQNHKISEKIRKLLDKSMR